MKKIILICLIVIASNNIFSQEMYVGQDYVIPNFKLPVDDLLEIKWSIKIKRNFDPPIVIDGLVFLEENFQCAIDAETGKKLYFDSTDARQHFKKTIKDSIIYLGNLRKPICVNLYTGQKYRLNRGLPDTRIYTVKDSTVYVYKNRNKDTLIAYNIISEKIKWEYPYNPRLQYIEILNNKLILSDVKNTICIDSNTGEEIWELPGLYFKSNIIIYNNELYSMVRNKGMCVFDINSGDEIISFPNLDFSKILRSNDTIFLPTPNAYFAFDMEGKTILWESNESFGSGYEDAGLLDNYIITYDYPLQHGGEILAANKLTGKIEYQTWETTRFDLSEEELAEMDHEGNVIANSFFFSEEWNNMIFATCTNDSLYCFQIKTPEKK